MITRKNPVPTKTVRSVLRGPFKDKARLVYGAIKTQTERDALAFCTRAGVTSDAGRIQISNFVRGCKRLGIWSSLICWPMRSYQNAPSGDTLYSLGGLATRNGTISGPARSPEGMVFDGLNDRVTGSSIGSNLEIHVGFFGKFGDLSNNPVAVQIDGLGLRSVTSRPNGTWNNTDRSASDTSRILTTNTWLMFSGGFYNTVFPVASRFQQGFNNAYTNNIGDPSLGSATVLGISIGASIAGANYLNGTIALVYMFNPRSNFLGEGPATHQSAAFYRLCQTTLLSGLPIP